MDQNDNEKQLFNGLKELGYSSDEIAKLIAAVVTEKPEHLTDDCASWLATVAEVTLFYALIEAVLGNETVVRFNRENGSWEARTPQKPEHALIN